VCAICIGPAEKPVDLPCGHAYCGSCLGNLRKRGGSISNRKCPLCRADLPPDLDRLYDLAERSYHHILRQAAERSVARDIKLKGKITRRDLLDRVRLDQLCAQAGLGSLPPNEKEELSQVRR